MRRTRRGERGAAAVEFALVLPVLLLILFGIVDFGRMLYAKITITEAAREGARAAALVDEDSGRTRIEDSTANLDTSGSPLEIVIDPCPDPPGPDDDATVTLTYDFGFVTPISLFAGLGGSDGRLDLTATSVMPCLN